MYSLIAPLYPLFSCRKIRYEDGGKVAIVAGEGLDVSFFNAVSVDIIQLADGSRTIEDIFTAIKDKYEVEDSVLQDDLTEFVRDLQWRKLLTLRMLP